MPITQRVKNPNKEGRERSERIFRFLRAHRFASAGQISDLFFPAVAEEWRLRKAKERLRILTKRGLIKMFYNWDGSELYGYERSRNSHLVDHQLAVNDVVISILRNKASWEQVRYDLEYVTGEIRADIYIVITNTIKRNNMVYYIEIQLESNEPITDKLQKYTPLLMDQEEAKLIALYKHKRTAAELASMRLPVDIRSRVQAIPLNEFNGRLN